MFEIDMQHCANCGSDLKINAVILKRSVIEKVLKHPGAPPPERQPVARRYKRPDAAQP